VIHQFGTIIRRHARDYVIFALLVGMCIVAWVMNPRFASVGNLSKIMEHAAPAAIGACGMTVVMIAGGFDLSVGSIAAMAGMVAASVVVLGYRETGAWPLYAAVGGGILGACLVGSLLGLANGVLISRIGINPFVTTLGSMLMVRSLVQIYSHGGKPINLPPAAPISGLYWGKCLGVPMPIVLSLGAVLATVVLLRWTRFGYYCYAIGGNERAAWLSGIRTRSIKQATYVLAGLAAGVAGLLILAKPMNAQATAATGYELDVIAGVIIGGTPLGGGRGAVFGTVIGVLTLEVINNLLVFLEVPPSWQEMLTGAIIVGAVAIDRLSRRSQGGPTG